MDISGLKEFCRRSGFRPDKRLGQNFLVDKNIRDKIIASLPVDKNTAVLEIGPGLGVMTGSLADVAEKVYAVEKDELLFSELKELFEGDSRIDLIHSDILDTDIGKLADDEGRSIFVYGNIPYNITAPVITKVITLKHRIRSFYMVLQDEVALRLSAVPGSREYGSLACFAGYYARVKKLFKISRNCFFPVPKVDSRLIGLEMLEKPPVDVADEQIMLSLVRKAFSQRRKKALNAISNGGFMNAGKSEWTDIFVNAGIDPGSRAEELSLRDYADITNELVKTLT